MSSPISNHAGDACSECGEWCTANHTGKCRKCRVTKCKQCGRPCRATVKNPSEYCSGCLMNRKKRMRAAGGE